jgi:hypothetical protein
MSKNLVSQFNNYHTREANLIYKSMLNKYSFNSFLIYLNAYIIIRIFKRLDYQEVHYFQISNIYVDFKQNRILFLLLSFNFGPNAF